MISILEFLFIPSRLCFDRATPLHSATPRAIVRCNLSFAFFADRYSRADYLPPGSATTLCNCVLQYDRCALLLNRVLTTSLIQACDTNEMAPLVYTCREHYETASWRALMIVVAFTRSLIPFEHW